MRRYLRIKFADSTLAKAFQTHKLASHIGKKDAPHQVAALHVCRNRCDLYGKQDPSNQFQTPKIFVMSEYFFVISYIQYIIFLLGEHFTGFELRTSEKSIFLNFANMPHIFLSNFAAMFVLPA